MPLCQFYAAAADHRAVLEVVFSLKGSSLWELASRHDQPLREFRHTEEVLAAFDLNREGANFHLYHPSMGGRVHHKRVTFHPGAVPGATYRYDSVGWGLIQFYLRAPKNARLSPCHTNHNSEKRARAWQTTYADELGEVQDWNWDAVQSLSSRLNRGIRKLGVAKFGTRPILPAAQSMLNDNSLQLSLN
ncbi:MAG: hypothetical protein KF760_33675 [Candidatus Eremiobacteraeota bacterium]|nr:hypothetical protein [Candidatus Eremiobacteraeota bacterium]MCW5869853.1 hypothetical protein [Candidatus Eremiobacteraeota bacterium]